MTLNQNKEAAQQALNYVRSLGIRSSNRRGDRVAVAGGIESVIRSGNPTGERRQGPLGDRVTAMRNMQGRGNYDINNVLASAQATRNARVGNCGELCDVVVEFLHNRTGVRPVDIMSFGALGYDHAFVVIGLGPQAGEWRETRTDRYTRNLRDWGDEAVWCDPWQGGGRVFAVKDFIEGRVLNLDFRYRCHSREAVEAGAPASIFRLP